MEVSTFAESFSGVIGEVVLFPQASIIETSEEEKSIFFKQ